MTDCIFCRIQQEKVPAHIVQKDDCTTAFLDNSPKSCGHTLVITNNHYPNLYSTPTEELETIINSVKQVAEKIQQNLSPAAVKIVQNNGRAAGQTVPHLHFHIIPYYTNQPPHSKKEFEKIAAQIKQ